MEWATLGDLHVWFGVPTPFWVPNCASQGACAKIVFQTPRNILTCSYAFHIAHTIFTDVYVCFTFISHVGTHWPQAVK